METAMANKRIRAAMAAAIVLAGGAAAVIVAQPALAATAAFTRTSTWDTGYQAQFTITNNTSATTTSWIVQFDLPGGTSMGTYWDALVTTSAQHVTATNRSWNGTLAPGATTTFGFVAVGTGNPTNCTVNGTACGAAGTPPTTNPPNPQAPGQPGTLAVTATTTSSISLSWGASSGTVTGYRVYEGTTVRATVPTTSTAITGLGASTSHTYAVRAYNSAGESAASNSVTATTAGSGGGSGTVRAAPYVDMGSWPTPVLTTMASAGNLKNFTLAFITASACKAMWFNAFDPRQQWGLDQVSAIRAGGGDVKISFGGASGIELAQACSTVDSVLAEYQAVVTAYSLKYIDLDIEGAASAEPVSIARRSQALARLQQANPGLKVSLTLPALPEGLTADGINVVRSARDAGVTIDLVNIMAMDYYRAGDYGTFAVQAAQATFGQLKTLYPGLSDAAVWRMVGVTPMLGQNDDSHVYDQADARQLVAFAQQQHLGMLAFWEMTRDRNACTGALFMCTNIAQQPYEFSKIFAGFTG
jgi:hypothetical protein